MIFGHVAAIMFKLGAKRRGRARSSSDPRSASGSGGSRGESLPDDAVSGRDAGRMK